jgi:hypothetical protein
VENILQKVISGEMDFTIKLHWQDELPAELERIKDKQHFSNAFFISDTTEIDILSTAFKKFYNTEVLSFFDKYKNLANVLDWLSENEIQKHADLLVVNNNLMMLRKLIIMKECHSPEYEDLYNRYSSFLKKKQDEGESPYLKMFDNFLMLEDYFNRPSFH